MNDAMYEHPATRANLESLRARGAIVLEPGTGALGSPGEWGIGRLPEPPELLAAVESALGATGGGDLDGLSVLVTAGGTREPIDAVRFVGNRSSGRMGWALAAEAARRGARVTVIAANVSLPRRPGVRYVDVETAAELKEACERELDGCDVVLMAAAVADYRPADPRAEKITKEAAGNALTVELERTDDVLAALAERRRPDQVLVGFAAETGPDGVARAREKLTRKRVDAIVLNDVSAPGIGFDAADNEVTIITATAEHAVPRAGKDVVARAILSAVLSRPSSSALKV
jgi:phosphopantothenoylcysteine decarboxylase/phosphopantothenate--cysteine ligase